MNEVVVVYKSKYGSTKKYAKWIANSLKSDIFDSSNISFNDIMKYSTIIYGGSLCAGGILGISLITKSFNRIKNKNLIVFTVGLANLENIKQFEPMINKNFTKEMQEKIKLYHFRGSINYKNLNFIHRLMMALLKMKLDKVNKEKRDDETKVMIETYGKIVDFTNKDAINPLVNFVINHK